MMLSGVLLQEERSKSLVLEVDRLLMELGPHEDNAAFNVLNAKKECLEGALGGAASSLVRVPTEGYSSFLLRDLPFDAIQFCLYEQLRIGYKLVVICGLRVTHIRLLGTINMTLIITA
ncbi:hypothetical protein FRX31_027024 [Thalictrum thalictroides]|uniref:Uncharacterized protein n=1 Tax=Thalictrum thalictroides TaxID=46969 RepID=A0A7J6VE75_THATH|nr:hypothetical protein FRX31_027024 [Thalictrum thalictroides]